MWVQLHSLLFHNGQRQRKGVRLLNSRLNCILKEANINTFQLIAFTTCFTMAKDKGVKGVMVVELYLKRGQHRN